MMDPASEALPRVRLFVKAALAVDLDVALDPNPAHYLLKVMRLAAGDRILVFNADDGEWLAHLVRRGRGAMLRLERQIRAPEPEDGPWLAFAPVKKTATDFIVEKATELGASRIQPVMTERTISHRVNLGRLAAIATEAAEQCGRLSVPELAAPVPLPILAAAWPAERALLVAHPHVRTTTQPLYAAMAELCHSQAAPGSASPAGFLIGPEGGLTPAELDSLASLPCAKVISLGPRTLRAETAAAAVLACWQAAVEARCCGALQLSFKNKPGQP